MRVDLMVIGAHPDDIEIGISGTIAKYIQKNKNVILVDLTLGEMGSNGNAEIRLKESLLAAGILGVNKRINLEIEDRNIRVNKENIKKVVDVIRKYRPEQIFYPYKKDYHPDHEAAYSLVRDAIHMSGLIKYVTEYEKFRPTKSYCYYINDIEKASLFTDISDVYDIKLASMRAHKSQFIKNDSSIETYLNNKLIENVEIRDKYWGTRCNCKYSELLYYEELICLEI